MFVFIAYLFISNDISNSSIEYNFYGFFAGSVLCYLFGPRIIETKDHTSIDLPIINEINDLSQKYLETERSDNIWPKEMINSIDHVK